jgi:hypothetical protein
VTTALPLPLPSPPLPGYRLEGLGFSRFFGSNVVHRFSTVAASKSPPNSSTLAAPASTDKCVSFRFVSSVILTQLRFFSASAMPANVTAGTFSGNEIDASTSIRYKCNEWYNGVKLQTGRSVCTRTRKVMDMSVITKSEALKWDDFEDKSDIEQIFGDADSLDIAQVFSRGLPHELTLWAVLRPWAIEPNHLHEFACWCAERELRQTGKWYDGPDFFAYIDRVQKETQSDDLSVSRRAAETILRLRPQAIVERKRAWCFAGGKAKDLSEAVIAAQQLPWTSAHECGREDPHRCAWMASQWSQKYVHFTDQVERARQLTDVSLVAA